MNARENQCDRRLPPGTKRHQSLSVHSPAPPAILLPHIENTPPQRTSPSTTRHCHCRTCDCSRGHQRLPGTKMRSCHTDRAACESAAQKIPPFAPASSAAIRRAKYPCSSAPKPHPWCQAQFAAQRHLVSNVAPRNTAVDPAPVRRNLPASILVLFPTKSPHHSPSHKP